MRILKGLFIWYGVSSVAVATSLSTSIDDINKEKKYVAHLETNLKEEAPDIFLVKKKQLVNNNIEIIKILQGNLVNNLKTVLSSKQVDEDHSVKTYTTIIEQLKNINVNDFSSLEDLEEKIFTIKSTFMSSVDE